MPEALARADFDFTVQERPQRPRSAPGQKRAIPRNEAPGLGGQIAARLLEVLRQNPARSVVTLGLCGFAGMFMLNALWLQHGHRHVLDLPLYHQAAAQPKRPVPLPPQRSVVAAHVTSAQVSAAQVGAAATLPMLAPLPPRQPATATLAQGDGIDRLLGQSVDHESANAPDHSPRTLAVQRALARLGYKVVPDGVYGRTTRSAIARFEHAAKLPETGNMGQRMRTALAKRAGLAIP